MKNKKAILTITLGIVLVLILALTLITSTQEVEIETIKVGILTPLSGNLAFLGENIVQSAELAKEELGYENVEFIIQDSGVVGNSKDAISGYKKLVEVDNVKIIIDGMTSDGTMAVAPLLDKDKVVMITPLTGGENIDNAAEYLFRNGPSDIIAGTLPAKDLNLKEYEKVGLFTDNAEYTLDIAKHFKSTFTGEVIEEIVTPDLTDYKTEVKKILESKPEAIVVNTASGQSAAYIVKQLYEQKNTAPIYMNFIGYNENNVKTAGKVAYENTFVYDPEFNEDSSKTMSFFTEYEEKYDSQPAIPFHSTGTYDAVKMSVEAIDAAGYDGEKIHDYLLVKIQNWNGLNGIVSLDEKGNTETGFIQKQIINGQKTIPN